MTRAFLEQTILDGTRIGNAHHIISTLFATTCLFIAHLTGLIRVVQCIGKDCVVDVFDPTWRVEILGGVWKPEEDGRGRGGGRGRSLQFAGLRYRTLGTLTCFLGYL